LSVFIVGVADEVVVQLLEVTLLLVNVSVVALPTKVSVAVGKVTVPVLLIEDITGAVNVLLVNVVVDVAVTGTHHSLIAVPVAPSNNARLPSVADAGQSTYHVDGESSSTILNDVSVSRFLRLTTLIVELALNCTITAAVTVSALYTLKSLIVLTCPDAGAAHIVTAVVSLVVPVYTHSNTVPSAIVVS